MTRRKPKVQRVEEAGVRVRVFRRGDRYWLDVRLRDRPRQRVSADTADRAVAEAKAHALARAIAAEQILGTAPETLTLGQLFASYGEHKARTLTGQWKRGAETRARLFTAAWGAALPVVQVSQSFVDSYSADRRARRVAPPPRPTTATAATGEKEQECSSSASQRPLRDGALDADFRWLSSVFNWAVTHRLPSGKRLLEHNPLHDCTWPRERNVRRPIASHDRYVKTLATADAVDPAGRLRLVLVLARYTGRRESAILALRASDVLLSKERIVRALGAAGMDERLADHMPDGAIRWSAESDKQGTLHITPITKIVKQELEAYVAAHPRVGDVLLFPGVTTKTAARPLSRVVAARWLLRAEVLAGVPKLTGGTFHPYRRLWASERKHLADVDVAAAGGWRCTKTLAIYQQTDPAAILAAVVNGA